LKGSGGIAATQSTLTGGITNSGSISGYASGIDAGNSTLSGGITNSDSISGGSYGMDLVKLMDNRSL
jgi:hypothetical protein